MGQKRGWVVVVAGGGGSVHYDTRSGVKFHQQ